MRGNREVAEKQPDYVVFISHSSKDRWIATRMAEIIERNAKRYGVTTFLDEKALEAGDNIPETIRDRLHDCSEFVILLTPESVARPWVLIELGGAWTLRKRLIAITYNITADKIPDVIEHDKSYELNDFDRYVSELIRRTKGKRAKR